MLDWQDESPGHPKDRKTQGQRWAVPGHSGCPVCLGDMRIHGNALGHRFGAKWLFLWVDGEDSIASTSC